MNSTIKTLGSMALVGLLALPVLADEVTADSADDANLPTRVEYRFNDLSKGTTGTVSRTQNKVSAEAVCSF
jgi:hypothetical protein